ncbi:hypothetical protein BGZ60DRAFT_412210 [Tricladium varicosporioides]|nr:hypothetical protein BGZ60DRAFT_412210 [Hymenoscyphus varicosporioides]
MSSRNDTFPFLCLAQTEPPPLYYRLGRIIVHGSKVISMGFNSYRLCFDGGNDHDSNTPLSLHSEMAAIQPALSLYSGALPSQTSARSTKYFQKPCFSLPGDSKKRKLRARSLKACTKTVCKQTEAGTTNSIVAGSIFKLGF